MQNLIYNTPDFLIIGAARSGTTWIYENLKRNNQIWLPPNKEIHYFDRDIKYDSPSILYDDKFLKRLFSRENYNKVFRKKMINSFKSCAANLNFKKLLWFIRYYCYNYDDSWYLSLFNAGIGKIRGDITPGYQLLDDKDIAHLHKIMPNIKLILILRNPIYRTWSQLRKNKQSKLPINEIKKIINSPGITDRNDYLKTLNKYKKYFPEKNIAVYYFYELAKNPQKFLSNLHKFINVKFDPSSMIDKKINSAPPGNIPVKTELLLIENILPLLRNLDKGFGGIASRWLKEAEIRYSQLMHEHDHLSAHFQTKEQF